MPRKLTPTMLAILSSVSEGRDPYHDCHRKEQRGGRARGIKGLMCRGLIDNACAITDAGKLSLSAGWQLAPTVMVWVLQAAVDFTGEFTAPQLAVTAWRAHPQELCLDGYEEHPDYHAVLASMSGSRGLVGKGWLDRVLTGVYRVTDLGREVAKNPTRYIRGNGGNGHANPLPTRASQDDKAILARLLASEAYMLANTHPADLTFRHCADFFAIGGKKSAQQHIDAVMTALARLDAIADEGEPSHQCGAPRGSDVRDAANVGQMLLGKFERSIRILTATKQGETG